MGVVNLRLVPYRVLIGLYVALAVASYGLLRADVSEISVGWPELVLWAVLLWFIAHGSHTAWTITSAFTAALTAWLIAAFGLLGLALTAVSIAFVLLLALQGAVLFALRPREEA